MGVEDQLLELFKRCQKVVEVSIPSDVIGQKWQAGKKVCGRQVGDARANGCKEKGDCPCLVRKKEQE